MSDNCRVTLVILKLIVCLYRLVSDLLRVSLVRVCVVCVLFDGDTICGDVCHLDARCVWKHPEILV